MLLSILKRVGVVALASALTAAVLLLGIVPFLEWKDGRDHRAYWAAHPPPMPLGPDNPPGPDSFSPMRAVPPMQAITEIETKPADAVSKVDVADDDLVLGVTIGGQARAYPINMMTGPEREIFNDRLAGRSIAATW